MGWRSGRRERSGRWEEPCLAPESDLGTHGPRFNRAASIPPGQWLRAIPPLFRGKHRGKRETTSDPRSAPSPPSAAKNIGNKLSPRIPHFSDGCVQFLHATVTLGCTQLPSQQTFRHHGFCRRIWQLGACSPYSLDSTPYCVHKTDSIVQSFNPSCAVGPLLFPIISEFIMDSSH